MTALLLKAAKRTVRSVLSFGLVCTTYALVAEASGLGQPDSQTAKTQRSGNKTTTLLVDTDDTCHLFVDGEDKGTITPNAPQKFMTGPDEHILKCCQRKYKNSRDDKPCASVNKVSHHSASHSPRMK